MYLHLKQEASNTFWKCEMVEDYHCAASHLHFLKMRSHATARCGLGHSLTETINTLPVKHIGMTAYVAPKPVCKAGFSINGAFTDVMVCHVHYTLSHTGVKVWQRPPLQRIQWNFSSFSDWACNRWLLCTERRLHSLPGGKQPVFKQSQCDLAWLQSLSDQLVKVCK